MASTFTSILRLEKQGTGENDTSWGTKLNAMIDMIEEAISGFVGIATTGGSTTLTTNNSLTDQSRPAILKVTGVLVSNATLVIPAKSKQYIVWNATTGSFTLSIKTATGVAAVVTQAKKALIFCDGTDCYHGDDDQTSVTFPSGTRMPFQQTAAPTGWTKDTTTSGLDNSCPRFVTGTVGSGGADSFTTLFGTSKATAGFTLTTAEIPSHSHGVTDPGHTHTILSQDILGAGGTGKFFYQGAVSNTIPSNTTGISINNTGSGGSHAHTLSNMNLKYMDLIIASKD